MSKGWRSDLLVAALTMVSLPVGSAGAAEVKVLSTTAVSSVLAELAPEFERVSGHKITAAYATAASLVKRILDGEAADVVILTTTGMDELAGRGKLIAGSRSDVARSGIGVAVRKGAHRPDIGSADALKQALLRAGSVAYTDPASGGASGVHFVKILDRLGIEAEVKAKSRLAKGAAGELVGDIIARGEAEIGVQQLPELKAASGVDILGPLPAELQSVTQFAAGVLVGASQREAGTAFIQFLTAPAAAEVFKAKGLEPN
jgi:molybdate transport system substrate-binding protein